MPGAAVRTRLRKVSGIKGKSRSRRQIAIAKSLIEMSLVIGLFDSPWLKRKTLDKLAAQEATRALVLEHLRPMLLAQIAHAQGIGHVYTRDANRKFSRIENPDEADRLLLEGRE